ncbi:carbohydrate kinase [Williamsia sp. CHRR-6]|uniref:carbohydrate kinase family protein n=1 Tax=Williamsia sp. CHRR-6 TaxID=2835871 RepID=UPI001BDAF0F0|nr:carbohydrate kinase [Williamsia sp. CHRR-6]MBT0566435.1 carbohydrate kinase [Williamsia sp. CHRR-6]
MKEVVVCGEALVDLVLDERLASIGSPLPPLVPALGGGPFNVSVALGRLGSAVSFCSRVSTDRFGAEIIAALRAAGVDLSVLQRDPAPTSLALASIGAGGAASYSFYVEGTADRLVTDPGPLPGTVAALCFGTLSLVLEPGASVYEQMMHTHHAHGRLIMVDPNIRPVMIADPDAYRARLTTWLPAIDVIKVSDDDADWLAQGPYGSTPADWLAAGVGAVVLTRGAGGLSVTTARGETTVAAPQVSTVDTIGAGDTVVGALLHWLGVHDALGQRQIRDLEPDLWGAALTFAARAAAVTVSRAGADPPWARELANS